MSKQAQLPDDIWVTGGYLIGPEPIGDSEISPYCVDPLSLLGAERIRRLDPLSQYALVAVELAYQNAGLPRDPSVERKPREGVTLGSALGAAVTSVRYAKRLVKAGPAGTNPIDFPDSIDGSAAAHVALDRGLCGPSVTFVDGEQSAASALVFAARLIARGRVERMVVVAGDFLDEVFSRALVRETQATGKRVGQAVMALVLERAGLRPAPPNTVTLLGFSPKSAMSREASIGETDARSESVTTRWFDPSGVLSMASAWRSAVNPSVEQVDPWRAERVRSVPIKGKGRAWFVDNQTYAGLSFVGLNGAERN
jgi:hypothetical protein